MGRLRGFLWLAAGLVVAALAGVVAFMTLSGAAPQEAEQAVGAPPQVSVVVAAQQIGVRSLLTAEDLEMREIPVDAIPDSAVRQMDDAVGKLTLADIYPGEVILEQRLVDPNVVAANGRTAVVINDDQVLMAFPAGDLMSNLGVLKPGDHVDLLLSYELPADTITGERPGPIAGTAEEGTELTTFTLLQNLELTQIMRGEEGGTTAYLLAVSPQDALLLKYIKDVGPVRDLVLRAPGVEVDFRTDPVDLDYLINLLMAAGGGETP
ncbi:MAG: Flp pilus assembly protein CpaB [Chloroflexota bacterium]|nr:Flp pilus assembly protein CpaB [Chloroflexota bacterium]